MAGRKKADKEAGSETDEAEVETKVSFDQEHDQFVSRLQF